MSFKRFVDLVSYVFVAAVCKYIYVRIDVLPELLWSTVLGLDDVVMRRFDGFVAKLVTIPEPEPPTEFELWRDWLTGIWKLLLEGALCLGYWSVGLVAVSLAMYCSRRSLMRLVLKMRGIQFEAMQPGSDFESGEVPDCQVEILDAGVFCDTFIGYGVRFGSLLAVPTHVMNHVRMLVVKGKVGKLAVNVSQIRSRAAADLTYIPLTETQWSRIGGTSARTPKKLTNALVSCSGRRGTSSGLLTQTDVEGVMKYSGSTVNGMSGAAYYSGATVHGIHTGVSGELNIGISSLLISAEIRRLTYGESPTLDELKGLTKSSKAKVQASWNLETMMKKMDHLYADDLGWADDEEIDYGAQLDFGEAAIEECFSKFMKLPAAQRESAVKVLDEYNRTSRIVKGQSDAESDPIELPKDFVTMRLEALEKRVDALEKRGTEKREKKSGVAKPNQSPKPFSCGWEGCYKGFNTQAALLAHQVARSHVAGESAYGTDSKATVATKPVFRKPLNSRIGKSRSLQNTSSSVEQPGQSTSPQQSQLSTPESLERIAKSLQESLGIMAGLVSDITQKCKA